MKSKPKNPAVTSWETTPGLRSEMRIRGFGHLLFRPIEPQDEALMTVFHAALSEETIYQRYFEHMSLENRTRHERLVRICHNDEESFALVAARLGPKKRAEAILAVGRLSRTELPDVVEFALLVQDKAQGHGIGTILLKKILEIARVRKFRQLRGEVLVANHDMQHVCREFGFTLHTEADEGVVRVMLEL